MKKYLFRPLVLMCAFVLPVLAKEDVADSAEVLLAIESIAKAVDQEQQFSLIVDVEPGPGFDNQISNSRFTVYRAGPRYVVISEDRVILLEGSRLLTVDHSRQTIVLGQRQEVTDWHHNPGDSLARLSDSLASAEHSIRTTADKRQYIRMFLTSSLIREAELELNPESLISLTGIRYRYRIDGQEQMISIQYRWSELDEEAMPSADQFIQSYNGSWQSTSPYNGYRVIDHSQFQ